MTLRGKGQILGAGFIMRRMIWVQACRARFSSPLELSPCSSPGAQHPTAKPPSRINNLHRQRPFAQQLHPPRRKQRFARQPSQPLPTPPKPPPPPQQRTSSPLFVPKRPGLNRGARLLSFVAIQNNRFRFSAKPLFSPKSVRHWLELRLAHKQNSGEVSSHSYFPRALQPRSPTPSTALSAFPKFKDSRSFSRAEKRRGSESNRRFFNSPL